MLGLLGKGIKKIFGTKSDKDLKLLFPYVEKINIEFERLSSISDQELRDKTSFFKQKISETTEDFSNQIDSLKKEYSNEKEQNITLKEKILKKIDNLQLEEKKVIEKTLNDILPEAFAVVKETARRFSVNKKLSVKAEDFDHKIAQIKDNVLIEGDKAIWINKWSAAGIEIEWNMIHYDVQLIGGVVLHQGKISEMATGEGKTLVATLPAYLNALSGKGVHIVTVNDYLAKRDAEWNGPIFEFHGLDVDCIDKYSPNSQERIDAYNCNITYGTNNEFGFDYLRDNMVREKKELVQRELNFAMVDEVDSVLVDEARTPLIISGPIPKGDDHEFFNLKPRVSKLVDLQKKLVTGFLSEAKKLIEQKNEEDGGLALFRAFRGLPKYKPLIKFLSETGIKSIMQKTENYYLQDNSKFMPEADKPLYYTIEEKSNSIQLTDKGIDIITSEGEDLKFFIIPDIGNEINKIENNKNLKKAEIIEKKASLISDYGVKTKRIHAINQLLKAYSLFEKDQEYVVMDEKVKIVDEQTGRIMEGRRYSDGLHQAIEAKENVKIEDATQTYATITLQNFFRMYNKLSGMTGTAETEAGELWEIYKLDCIVIPTNKEILRNDMQDKVYKTLKAKFSSIIEEILELKNEGRPSLVGTTSVEISELLSRMLTIKKIKHQVLNAKQHAREAEVVAEAGKPGAVTIATNMAGRGTDIKLSSESRKSGGLAIIGTERHESRRVDRQLRGRSGRQGDVGSSQFFVSLEDNLMRLFGSDRMTKVMDRLGIDDDEVIQHSMITKSIERAQKKVEENNFAIRKRLLEYDNVMNSQREVIYKRRKNALNGERLDIDILNMFYDTCEDIVLSAKETDNFDDFKLSILGVLGLDFKIDKMRFEKENEEQISLMLYESLLESYNLKNENIKTNALPVLKRIQKERGATVKKILIPFTDGKKQIGVVCDLEKTIESNGDLLILEMQKIITLSMIDINWKEHLREMDDLKQSVQSAVYEQKDPLIIYKFEGFELFKRFIAKVNKDTVSFLTSSQIPINNSDEVKEADKKTKHDNYATNKEESKSLLSGKRRTDQSEDVKSQPIKSNKIYGRNTKVSVRYQDGSEVKNIKYKKIENDINQEKCVIIND